MNNYEITDYKSRLEYALAMLRESKVEHYIINRSIGQIRCYRKSTDERVEYYAGTGTIVPNIGKKGIYNLIEYCNN